jgi:hypothetical protein
MRHERDGTSKTTTRAYTNIGHIPKRATASNSQGMAPFEN